jgi:hypothetical protein
VIDAGRQITEEPVEGSGIRGVESRGVERAEFPTGDLEALGIPSGEYQFDSRRARSARRFEPYAGAAADHDDGLSAEFRIVLLAAGIGCAPHDFASLRAGVRCSG